MQRRERRAILLMMSQLPPDGPDRTGAGASVPERFDDVLEVLATARSTRRFAGTPVAPEVLERLVWAATRAASANNCQPWSFVIVTEPARLEALAAALRPFESWIASLAPPADEDERRTRAGAARLLADFAALPAVIAVCAQNVFPADAPRPAYMWSAVGGAVQNLLVAARAMELGAAPTMFHVLDERSVSDVLALPEGWRVGALVAVGTPLAPAAPVRRRSLDEVIHWQRWSGAG